MIRNGKLVYGVGINDADYFVYRKENGNIVWACPYYEKWTNMLQRGYSDKFKKKYPTYQDASVCEEWYSFMCFRAWMMCQNWEGKHLDKDILIEGNKVYSPDTCVFVDAVVNTFLNDHVASRGEWPLGVCWHEQRQKFVSHCRNTFTKKKEYLGLFTCPNQAHLAWKKRKYELACQLADLQTDERVAQALRIRYK